MTAAKQEWCLAQLQSRFIFQGIRFIVYPNHSQPSEFRAKHALVQAAVDAGAGVGVLSVVGPSSVLRTIQVENLRRSTTSSRLEDLFTRYGTVIAVRLPVDRVTRVPRGRAFIDFAHPSQARAALKHGGKTIGGRCHE